MEKDVFATEPFETLGNDVLVIETKRRVCVIHKSTLQLLRENDGGDWTEEEVTDLIKYFGNEDPYMNTHKTGLFFAGVLILKNCDLNSYATGSLKEIKWAIENN